jgi:hypothetical protein
MMLGPVTNGRYIYPMLLCFPLYVVLLLCNQKDRSPAA